MNAFEYAVLRAVPRIDRGERMNVGVIVYCQALDYLGRPPTSTLPGYELSTPTSTSTRFARLSMRFGQCAPVKDRVQPARRVIGSGG
jgi:hypothetical protein